MKKLLLLLPVLFVFSFSSFTMAVSNPVAVTSVEAIEQVVYVTKTGDKYHKSSCHYLKRSKIKITKSEAQSLGYTACKVCKP